MKISLIILIINCIFYNQLFSQNKTSKYSFENQSYFQEFIKVVNSNDQIPDKFRDKIYRKRWSNWSDFFSRFEVVGDTTFKINNKRILVIYDLIQNTEFGRSFKQLNLYNQNGKFLDNLNVINYSEDWATGVTIYSYGSFNLINDQLQKTSISHHDINSTLPILPDKKKIITHHQYYKIGNKFIYIKKKSKSFKTRAHYTLASLKVLKQLNKKELRIARNYYFAKYGYDFNSDFLKEYFKENLMNYSPKFKNVDHLITRNERKLINYIIKLEKEK